ncbi:Rha family transcriptional regulator [Serratia fonticola]|uniref:Rha family transcriptional regulator n=1 Tax=Serratia fonticola TaxID=47917 RepID=UPI0009389D27|nr:Rha family transcriptional regulator [Serratia fonticola]OKP27570.1 hypothetical protein BSQ40_14560 [Serratia fonticola]
MNNQLAILTPEVTTSNGRVITTSKAVAGYFGKRHDDVLKKIRNLDCSPEFHARNFAEMFIDVKIGNGAVRQMPTYEITRDGFAFLGMGFTGKKAAQFKENYINAFNKMEAELLSRKPARKRIAPPAIDTKRFITCFSTIETAWSQIHSDLLIIDPRAAREVSAMMETVLRVGRTYQVKALRHK